MVTFNKLDYYFQRFNIRPRSHVELKRTEWLLPVRVQNFDWSLIHKFCEHVLRKKETREVSPDSDSEPIR